MEITLTFLKLFFLICYLASPLLIGMALLILMLGQVVGRRERWSRFDALYWSFVTATTLGYGDLVPRTKLSKLLAMLIVCIGMVLMGLVVAIGVYAATQTFAEIHGISLPAQHSLLVN
ncbi:potassium channel family protein [Marinobacterium arenosum]|uniref:potassium channel family protein n=1 Tax=Marinobacterium arenosum TaxID=2862496 RepID=UPI001C962360|nr:potassium channel family protein [Marinobacterium arenosum]MBY4676032.1 potassium channel family protein [Marinobacterium arenosum]